MNPLIWLTLLLLAGGGGLVLFTRARRARRRAIRAEYARRLEEALEDGILTREELTELESFRAESEVSHAEARLVALAIYRRALRDAAADDHLTAEEDGVLRRLSAQLGVGEQDLGDDGRTLARLRALARIEAGRLPLVGSPVPLAADERSHWVGPCTLATRLGIGLGVGHSAVEEPHGRTFRVADTEPFHPGGARDALRPSPRILPADLGILVITDRRTLLRGARRSAELRHDQLVSITVYGDGVRLTDATETSHIVLVDDADLTAALLLQAARHARYDPATRVVRG
ncbi:MAG: hypothetical protein WEB88_14955 [Gemmatimonadota bacterium]